MAATGLQEFKRVVTDFHELSSLAVKGTVALPLLNLWSKVGPPPTTAIAVLTSGLQFLAVMWTFHFWHDTAEKNLNRRMRLCGALFVVGLIASGVLLKQFTVRPGPSRDPVVEGYALRSDVQPLVGPNHTPLDALREAEYDPSEVWTSASVTVVHVVLVVCWMTTFVTIAMFISTFLMLQRRRPDASVASSSHG
jgi:hypothetical protein